jgi:hypothetical protein
MRSSIHDRYRTAGFLNLASFLEKLQNHVMQMSQDCWRERMKAWVWDMSFYAMCSGVEPWCM